MLFLPFTLVLSSYLSSSVYQVLAGSQQKGQNCSQAKTRLQVGTYQLYSECDSETFCNSSSLCQLKGCRKDDFPFGYPQDSKAIPDKCPKGEFCPDEMDACQPLLAVNSPCQLNRDDQCEAPPNFKDLADTLNRGLNHNGSVCLNNVCMWANVTVGLPCVVENTAYIAYVTTGQTVGGEFIDIVSRGNCQIGLYCESQQKVCLKGKDVGVACSADKECVSYNCLPSGTCGVSADTPNHLPTWVYIVVGVGIVGGMFGTLLGMFFVHRGQRDAEREKRVQYWREQNAFRQNIMQMRDTATSILSGADQSRRSSFRDSSFSQQDTQPMMQHQTTKSSGLRQYYNENGSYTEFDETSNSHERGMTEGKYERPEGRF